MGDLEITVYLDNEYRCHSEPEEGFVAFGTDFFNGREHLIPYYRIVPRGFKWTDNKGYVFDGEMICPAESILGLVVGGVFMEVKLIEAFNNENKGAHGGIAGDQLNDIPGKGGVRIGPWRNRSGGWDVCLECIS